jgi:hypothetical protein
MVGMWAGSFGFSWNMGFWTKRGNSVCLSIEQAIWEVIGSVKLFGLG